MRNFLRIKKSSILLIIYLLLSVAFVVTVVVLSLPPSGPPRAQSSSTNTLKTKDYTLKDLSKTDITSISIDGIGELIIKSGSEAKLTVSSPEDEFPDITVTSPQDGELNITYKNSKNSLRNGGYVAARYELVCPSLDSIDLSNGATLRIKGIEFKDLAIASTDSTELNITESKGTGKLSITLGGSSEYNLNKLSLSGLDLSVGGESDGKITELAADLVTIDMEEDAKILVQGKTKKLKLTAQDSSELDMSNLETSSPTSMNSVEKTVTIKK